MSLNYAPREYITLPSGLPIEHPEELPELVHYDDAALLVFTDFTQVRPHTVRKALPVDEALAIMKHIGQRILLVTDSGGHLIGIVTACQIMGDDPVRAAEENGVSHDAVTVGMIMTPQRNTPVLQMDHLRDARVGHIIATLHKLEQRHILVIEDDAVRGLFAADQISLQIGHDVMNPEEAAHSVAEILRTIG